MADSRLNAIKPPLDQAETRKRKRERVAIILLAFAFVCLTFAEFKLSKVSSTLPFVNSIFFFGLLNINIVILIALVWLIFRNIGKLFLERRSRILGARLKTKLVVAFLGLSIIPTLVLFFISSSYINSSFDKWFSIKIQNTLQASLEITDTYYKNADRNAMHFSEHLAKKLGRRIKPGLFEKKDALSILPPNWIRDYLQFQRELLALDSIEFYSDPFDERILAKHPFSKNLPFTYPRLSLDLLDKALTGENVSVVQHIEKGDLIRTLVPVRAYKNNLNERNPIIGVLAVNAFIPVNLVSKAGEIKSVFKDYKGTNPLQYPIKTTYFVILIMITLVIVFVAIWIGLYIARELTGPVERLVRGAKEVGRGNLDVQIEVVGQDEIAVLVKSFNKMTKDLKVNRTQLTQASKDLEQRRLQLEAVLANIGAGVIVVDETGEISTFNRAASQLLEIKPQNALSKPFREVLKGECHPIVEVIERAFEAQHENSFSPAEVTQWNFGSGDMVKSLAGIATSLREFEDSWGVVVVIDDMTHLIKGQREMAWREVARRIAHEIKNPLTPIKLSAQRLLRKMDTFKGENVELIKECSTTIIKHTDELKDMVNEFSNFARLPQISPTLNNINSAINEAVSLYSQAHPKIYFNLSINTALPEFEFDRDQIKRVVINLIDNAIAALKPHDEESNKPKVIKIETFFNEQLQMATVRIEDNGPGMSDSVKARVFEPYYSTKSDGTGLGLAIAKRIVNDHDGFIRVHSVQGQGTQFTIELPTTIRHGFQLIKNNPETRSEAE